MEMRRSVAAMLMVNSPESTEMILKFPIYKSHEVVSCFNCGGDLVGQFWFKSGFPAGRGEFMQGCEKCQMNTYYDLEPYRERRR